MTLLPSPKAARMQQPKNIDSGLRKLASRTSLGIAVTLVTLKLRAWVVTGSGIVWTCAASVSKPFRISVTPHAM